MKIISVLLTTYSDWISSLVSRISGSGYSHSSIGLEEEEDCYYSFNYHGFALETIEKHRRRGVRKSLCLQIQVPDVVYEDIRSRIYEFREHKEEYHYTRLGLALAVCRIPLKWKHHYFCSQFVAQMLVKSHAVTLKRNPDLYLPNQFLPELVRCGSLKQVIYDVV